MAATAVLRARRTRVLDREQLSRQGICGARLRSAPTVGRGCHLGFPGSGRLRSVLACPLLLGALDAPVARRDRTCSHGVERGFGGAAGRALRACRMDRDNETARMVTGDGRGAIGTLHA